MKQLIFTTSSYIIPSMVIFLIFLAFFLYPYKFPRLTTFGCSVGVAVNPEGERPVFLPPIKNVGQPREGFIGGWDGDDPTAEYLLIRKNVPIFVNSSDPNMVIGYPDWLGKDDQVRPPQKLKWPVIADTDYLGVHADIRHTLKYPNANQPGFDVYFPNYTGEVELPFSITDRTGKGTNILTLRTEGFVIFVHLGGDNKPIKISYGPHIYYLVDWYQDKNMYETPKAIKGYETEDIFHCLDPEALGTNLVYEPLQNKSASNTQLQLEWFLFSGGPGMYSHCKPAVYLYPTQKQLVNVKVEPKGELAYTNPVYDPKTGWTVEANLDGTIYDTRYTINDKPFSYLYYESKIYDQFVHKPESGWVVKQADLQPFFETTLPRLGLNQREKTDFIDYWMKALPDSPYYFIGLIDKNQRDYLEPLTVTPLPDTSIRFSFYFELLNQPKNVTAPELVVPARKGFTLVDWGGMIKLYPGTPFTCSQ